MPGLIDTVYVRIRPLVGAFAEETTAGIRGALSEVNAQAADAARAAVASAGQEVDANRAVVASYGEVGDAAGTLAERISASLDATHASLLDQRTAVNSVAQANVDATAREIEANKALAVSYGTIAKAAKDGSAEQVAASKLAADASIRAGVETKAAGEEAATGFENTRKRLLSLSNVLGVGFGAAIGVDLIKHVVEDAAQAQKFGEVIRQEFGASAKQVFSGFRDSVATSLGVSSQLADSTSASFGILFHNLDVAPPLAAKMTVGFERLAGSLSQIKGVDPTTVMQSIVSAAAGNTRGLRMLGISIDTTSEKIAAFKLGLTQSITQALTPAQRAEAIFALATQHLGGYMDDAKKHSGDLASETFKLKAELSNAEGALGGALIPTVRQYVTELANWLQRAERSGRLQRDFNQAAADAKQIVAGVVGVIKEGVSIWDRFSGAVGGTTRAVEIVLGVMAVGKFTAVLGVAKEFIGVFTGIGEAAISMGSTIAGVFTTVETESVATAAVMDSALVSTGIGAIVVAVGVGAALIITHFSTVKHWIADFGQWVSSHAYALFAVPIVGQFLFVTVEVIKNFASIKAGAEDLGQFLATVWTHPIGAIETLWGHLEHTVVGILDDLEKKALEVALKIVEPFSHLPGFLGGGPFQALKKSIEGQLAALDPTKAVSAFAAKTGQLLSNDQQIGPVKDASKKAGKDAGAAFNLGLGDELGGPDGVASTLTAPMKPILDQLQNAITSAKTKIQSTIQDAKNNLTTIGDDLAKTIEQIQAKMGGAVGAIAGSPQGAAFAKLKQLIESGAPSFEIAKAQAELQGNLANVGKTQQPLIKTQLDNLTAEFNRGQIGYREFEGRLHKILHDDGVTLQQALKSGGPAFADAFRAQVRSLGEQAKQIGDIPAKYRGVGGAGGAADIKIIKPLETIRQENQKVADAAQRQRDQQIRYASQEVKYQAEILKQQQTQTALQQQFNGTEGIGGAAGARRAREAVAQAGVHTLGRRDPGATLDQIRGDQTQIATRAAAQRRDIRESVVKVWSDLGSVGKEIVAAEHQIAQPLNVLHQDNVQIAAEAKQQRSAQLRATNRIATELRSMRRSNGRQPGFGKAPRGKGSHEARRASKIGQTS